MNLRLRSAFLRFVRKMRGRLEMGESRYAGLWEKQPIVRHFEDLKEEALDLANYALFIYTKAEELQALVEMGAGGVANAEDRRDRERP